MPYPPIFLAPICRPSKIICLGINYADHTKEGGFEKPDKPQLFCKSSNTLNGPYDPILLPRSCGQIDWEVELAVIIAKECKRISKKDIYEFYNENSITEDRKQGVKVLFSLKWDILTT